jgi:hypothetical protein
MSSTLIQYVRKNKTEISPKKRAIVKRTHKIGVLVGFRATPEAKVRVGWSAVNRDEGDTFDKEIGLEIAKERSVPISESAFNEMCLDAPAKLRSKIRAFAERCNRYFK